MTTALLLKNAQGCTYSTAEKYYYRADGETENVYKWHPSIHMPKEAARIFLRVTDVRVERIKLISDEEVSKEGILYVSADGNVKDYLQRLHKAQVYIEF